jgi:SHS2 domain-containing protein
MSEMGHQTDRGQEPDYGYFPHDADIGVIGRGRTLAAAFVAAAAGMFAVMAELASVRPVREVSIAFEEPDRELALVRWLNALLAESRISGLAFGRFALRREGDRWVGNAWGEPWKLDAERGVEVKGATLTMLSVEQVDGEWETRCVVDV